METSSTDSRQTNRVPVMFWLTLVRGMMAITIGLALVLQREMTRPFLITCMGMFWLMSGLMSIRWGLSGERARGLPLLSGIVGVLAGVAALGRRFRPLEGTISETLAISVLGIGMLLTGLMHIVGGFRTGEDAARQRSLASVVLGFFEVVMGGMLVLAPLRQGTGVFLGASIWAMTAGVILIGDAFRLRSKANKMASSNAVEQ
jgi:uncharacterized membrane protein HdeD (DUF308 family)